MTSKQAQKAYKAANKGPKLTRAEIWKQEKAEQERIRKEFEKEKAAAKAKIAREKKKEKELAEKAEKRKKGLPLVNVRPSQETITWFARGNGSTKKRDAKGKDVKANTIEEETDPTETTAADKTDEEPQPPIKKVRTLESVQEDEQDTPGVGVGATAKDELQRPSPSPRGQDIQGAEEELMEDRGGVPVSNNSQHILDQPRREENILDTEDELDADFEEELALELLEDLEAAADKGCDQKPANKDESMHESVPETKVGTLDQLAGTGVPPANRYEEDLGLHRPNPPSVTFIKPALPKQRERPPASPSPSPPRQAPPMSTQAILVNFDDFFPSSSQQARELEEDDDIIPSAPALPAIVEEEEEEVPDEPEKPADPDPLPSLGPLSDSPSPPPRRFFTSSGSHEQMSLALHRSRRTAALEKIQQRERARVQAGMVARAETESCKTARPQSTKTVPKPQRTLERNAGGYKPRQPQIQAPPLQEKKNPPHYTTKEKHNAPMTTRRLGQTPKVQRTSPTKPPTPPKNNKENEKPPPPQPSFGPSASQESYGGDWVDEIALELMI
ncbi:hypothetical protein BHE90_009703 [Fusarium euwallaceae]|uniref:Uncharacterized protein n=3 Tax=Fusarium solani species complex TaxID=232080 RepID=A0A3M2S198_9HYPO|nr:hypothetical protein CDV36_009044 [Fusarium kuroshium]RSL51956.1 hypothetical protein CEP51_015140 [Fusarium floridanum]RTE75852.1 hypothetical protein BHE90_009703 [Fusarium euwallaceae]